LQFLFNRAKILFGSGCLKKEASVCDLVIEKVEKDGFELEILGTKIVAITYSSKTVRLGQKVQASGRALKEAGAVGKIVDLRTPFENGLTADVIDVLFEGDPVPCHMKFKDLDLSQTPDYLM
jgi:hypothetical protein